MTTATPKPRAGEHTETDTEARRFADGDYMADYVPASFARKLEAERDLLGERERELVEALTELAGDIEGIYDYCKRKDLMVVSIGQFRRLNAARALLAKHGR